MYLKKTYTAGITKEVHNTYSARYGKNISRGGNVNRTPEAVKNYNTKMAHRELTRLINENYSPGDIHLVLTYFRGERPGPKQAKKNLNAFLRKLRGYFKKQKSELKYIAVTAFGDRGAIHHHLIINTMDGRDIREMWPFGGSHVEYLYPDGEYSALAWYFIQQSRKSPAGELTGKKRWTCSKNLKRPVPTVKEVDAKTWREPPKAEPGYIIDVNSIDAGINPISGIPYLFYRMILAQKRIVTPDGAVLRGQEALEYQIRENRKAVQNEWENHKTEKLKITNQGNCKKSNARTHRKR